MSIVVGAVTGLFVGVVVGVLGAGGGILTVPILVYVLDFPPHSAAMASLVIIGTTSLVSLIPHGRRGNVHWAQGLIFGILGSVGAVVGGRLSAQVDAQVLMGLFAGLLLGIAVLMLRRAVTSRIKNAGDTSATRPDDAPPAGDSQRWWRRVLIVLLASIIGLLTGFFGVGGGFAVIPALLLIMRTPMRLAVGTSLLVIVVNTGTGLFGRVGESYAIDWSVVAAFTITSILGALFGAQLSRRIRPTTLTLLFAILLTAVALTTAVQVISTVVTP